MSAADPELHLLLFPRNGNCREALEAHRACPPSAEFPQPIGFVDDAPDFWGTTCSGLPVYGREAFLRFPGARVIAAPGSPHSFRQRRAVIESLDLEPQRFFTWIHPSAVVSPSARLGHNVVILPQVFIGPDVIVGNHVMVLPGSSLHHDVHVSDWTLVGSRVVLAGGVHVEENAYLGSGSTVIQGVRIGSGALVGMAANVLRDVPDGEVVAGNPARVLRRERAT